MFQHALLNTCITTCFGLNPSHHQVLSYTEYHMQAIIKNSNGSVESVNIVANEGLLYSFHCWRIICTVTLQDDTSAGTESRGQCKTWGILLMVWRRKYWHWRAYSRCNISFGARGSVVLNALCYKPEGRGFETLRGELIFFNLPNPSSRTRPCGLLSL
jgi:hypothetical protein